MWYYQVSRKELLDAIGKGWREKALERTKENRTNRALVRSSNTWSKIKDVYRNRQNHKCIFCEMELGRGKADYDVEHFRPKGKITLWPKPEESQYLFPTGGSQATGYYWLTYNPFNYAASCKHCNSALKRTYFPILGTRGLPHASIARLNRDEKPLLLFPFGPWGDNPADYFDFNGVLMMSKQGLDSDARSRAEVTIKFFDLNQAEPILRLRHERIIKIFEMYSASKKNGSLPGSGLSLQIELGHCKSQAFFTNHYFARLRSSNPDIKRRAEEDYVLSVAFLRSNGIVPVPISS